MKLYLCGGIAVIILLTACGQMGPLVLPPKEAVSPPKVHEPVTVQPPVALPPSYGSEPASNAGTTSLPGMDKTLEAPAEPKKEKP